VAEVVLQPSSVHAFAGQGVASGIPQHVEVDREWQLGAFACAFDHPGNAHAAEGLAALIDEDIGWLDPALGVIALQGLVVCSISDGAAASTARAVGILGEPPPRGAKNRRARRTRNPLANLR